MDRVHSWWFFSLIKLKIKKITKINFILQLNCKAIGFKYCLTKTSPSCEWEDNRRPLGATISTCFLLTFLHQVLIKTKNGWHAARVNGATVYGPPTHPPSNNISSKKYMIYSVFSSKDFYSLYSWEQRQKRLWDISFSFFFIIIIIIFAGEFSTPSRALKTAVYKDGETLN
jgi:hypothetical protein